MISIPHCIKFDMEGKRLLKKILNFEWNKFFFTFLGFSFIDECVYRLL